MAEGSREYTVVLAYGPADAQAAAALVEELGVRRQAVLPVVIEASDAPLLEACAKLGGRGLFVIARGTDVAASRADALRSVLRDIGVPMSRSLVLMLDAAGPKPFVDRVVTVLRRITSGTDAGRTSPSPRPTSPPEGIRVEGVRAVESSGTTEVAPRMRFDATPPAFDTASHPTAPGVVHAAAIAVDASAPVVPHRRRLAVVATGLASVAVLLWWALPDRTPAAEPVASDPGGKVMQAAASPTAPAPAPAATVAPAVVATTETAPAPAIEDADVIVDALRKREIRALDVFVVAPESKKPDDFAGASATCGSLKIGGIDEWRLPEIGELISMSRAKMLRKGSYWSSTKGDTFGDLRLVLVVKRERLSPIPAGWDGGRVICVRERG